MNLIAYKGYYGSVEASPEDNCLFGKVQFIRHLISYEGETFSELRQNFQSAIENYLSYCKETNLQPEQPFKGSFNIRPGRELHRKVAIISEELGISINEFIKAAISEKLAHMHRLE